MTLRHLGASGGGGQPRGWPWTLAFSGALVLALALRPPVGSSALGLLALVAASGLVVVEHRLRWLFPIALAVVVPAFTLAQPAFDLASRREQVRWATYAAAAMVLACLLVYGLSRLTRVSAVLQEAQREAVDSAAVREQLRLAQDAHDTLGLGLSTIALKSDLALSLLDSDPERSRHEAVQLMHLASVVSRDAEAVSRGRVALDLEQELVSARTTLEAAGVQATVHVDAPVPADVQDVLATVLREAVTNVVRHSRATVCSISLERDALGIVLRVTNDRVVPPRTSPGLGLSSMAGRLRGTGGHLVARQVDDRFEVTAMVALPKDALVPQ
jgi:two-component system sensor histidine kinase DesK